jgi:hypothetical protein
MTGFQFQRFTGHMKLPAVPEPGNLGQRAAEVMNQSAAEVMNQVLVAEREAREAMEGCDRQADLLLRKARERVRQLRQRTEERIHRWYLASDRGVANCVRDLDERERGLRRDLAPVSELPPEWRTAVRRLVDELIGGKAEPPGP